MLERIIHQTLDFMIGINLLHIHIGMNLGGEWMIDRMLTRCKKNMLTIL